MSLDSDSNTQAVGLPSCAFAKNSQISFSIPIYVIGCDENLFIKNQVEQFLAHSI